MNHQCNVQKLRLVHSALLDINAALIDEGNTKSRVCLALAREALETVARILQERCEENQ